MGGGIYTENNYENTEVIFWNLVAEYIQKKLFVHEPKVKSVDGEFSTVTGPFEKLSSERRCPSSLYI
jgi:hypothetical protein